MNKTIIFIGLIGLILMGIFYSIVHFFGILFLVRILLGVVYASVTILFAILVLLLAYARHKYTVLSLLGLVMSAYATYQSYVWSEPMHILYITGVYLVALGIGIWWLMEPDMSLVDRMKSAESLERKGKFRVAARKYEKDGKYEKAAECYLKAEMPESAAWCYEKAGEYKRVAEIYTKLAEEKGGKYWKEAYEFWKRANE